MDVSRLLGLPVTASGASDRTPPHPRSTVAGPSPPATLYDTIVYIHVGAEHQVFGLHKGLLSYHSAYFRAALNKTHKWKEAQDGVIMLADEDPLVFSFFNNWLYTGALSAVGLNARMLLLLYVFAEKRLVHRLMNAVVDTLLRHLEAWNRLSTLDLHFALTNTRTMRALLVDYFLKAGNLSGVLGFEGEFVAAVAVRVTELLKAANGDGDVYGPEFGAHLLRLWEWRCERYHYHEPGDEPCVYAEESAGFQRYGL